MQQNNHQNLFEPSTQQETNYQIFIWTRRVQLIVSSLCLFFIFIDIVRRKVHVFTSLKLFMFSSFFYLIGMAIVLIHNQNLSGTEKIIDKEDQISFDGNLGKTFCGLQAFVNLFSYNIAYCFTLLITVNVYLILNDNHRSFMKNVFANSKTIALFIIMFIVYLLPFVFIYLKNPPYSYGPTGLLYKGKMYLVYCGISSNMKNTYFILSFISAYFFPFVLFCIHTILLYIVGKKIKSFQDRNYLNSKQKFIIHSSKISFTVYCIQAINFIKTVMIGTLSLSNNPPAQIIIIILNYLFDLYPFVLLFYYRKYLGKSKGEKINNESLLTLDELKQ